MKIGEQVINHSSFMTAELDFELICSRMLQNDRLKKLLFYQTANALSKKALSQEETLGLLNKNIRIVPRLDIDENVRTYIIIGFDNFAPNATNPEFRDNTITFDIICHFDTWLLGDYQLRPYKIMGEIDGMLDKKRLTGIGQLQFMGANQLLLNDKLGGLTLTYAAIHGGEDKAIGV